jgi:CDP-paratose 2-epimerase
MDRSDHPTLITGGAGFVGSNLAERLLRAGLPVRLLDDLSRHGSRANLRHLEDQYGNLVEAIVADICDQSAVARAVRDVRDVIHLAAQVSTTASVVNPRADHRVNVSGTDNLVNQASRLSTPPPIIFSSSNKVYGDLRWLELREYKDRYEVLDPAFTTGISEQVPLSFASPYAESKATAERRLAKYAETAAPAAILRMSCVYGPRQWGDQRQGWVGHFVSMAVAGKEVVIFGDGKQVRDLLFIDDLVDAFLAARHLTTVPGAHVVNVGGGLGMARSLRELSKMIESQIGEPLDLRFERARHGDQKWYVSNTGRFTRLTGWAPKVAPNEGLAALIDWRRHAELRPAAVA